MVVLALCVPSYAGEAVLVYNVTVKDNPTIIDVNNITGIENTSTATMVTNFTVKGVLVFDVNTDTLETVYMSPDSNGLPDPNKTPTMILTGKDPVTQKKFTVTLQGDAIIHKFIITGKNPKQYASLNWEFTGVADANIYSETAAYARFLAASDTTYADRYTAENMPSYQEQLGAFGNLLPTLLVKGGKTKVNVPRTLAGIGSYGDNISTQNAPIGGGGTVNVSLDVATTQKANSTGLTVQDVADAAEVKLQ